jgi:hypothetical protein
LNDEHRGASGFPNTHQAGNIKTRNRINCCSFFFALSKKFARRAVFGLFFCKMALSFPKIGTIKESVLIE